MVIFNTNDYINYIQPQFKYVYTYSINEIEGNTREIKTGWWTIPWTTVYSNYIDLIKFFNNI